METVLINFKDGAVMTFNDVWVTTITGNFLVLVSKKTQTNDSTNESYVLTTNTIFNLTEVLNYTVKNKTEKYDQK